MHDTSTRLTVVSTKLAPQERRILVAVAAASNTTVSAMLRAAAVPALRDRLRSLAEVDSAPPA
ncbi:MAG: hypothetical protein ACHQWU_05495 [Gemmatimonadales bacterium]|jgi:hypothetical protein